MFYFLIVSNNTLYRIYRMYSGLQNCVSIVSIMTFDIIGEIFNFELNPYISSVTIDDYCTQFCKAVYGHLQKGMQWIIDTLIIRILIKIFSKISNLIIDHTIDIPFCKALYICIINNSVDSHSHCIYLLINWTKCLESELYVLFIM